MALHSDARQVSDLAKGFLIDLSVYDRGSETPKKGIAVGKSETCRASEWQSTSHSQFAVSDAARGDDT